MIFQKIIILSEQYYKEQKQLKYSVTQGYI